MKLFLLQFFFSLLILFSTTELFAQCPTGIDPGCDPNDIECICSYDPCNPICPIDGGVVALLAAGVGYGIKKARDSRKRIDNQSEPL